MQVVILAITLFAQIGPGSPIVTPPNNTTTNVIENKITVLAPAPDPEAIAEASTQSSQAILNTIVVPPPVEWTNDLLGLPDIWRTTPPELTYANSAIRERAELIRNVALVLLALALFAAGAGYALAQDVSFGRVAFAIVLTLGNLTFWEIGINLNNAITASLAAPDLPSMIRPHLETASLDPAAAVSGLVLLLVYVVTALLLLFSLAFRLGVVDVLIAVGSLASLCWVLPQTEYLAAHYTRLSVAVLFGQVLIVLGLGVASVLGSLGSGGSLATLLSIVVLWLVRTLPGMLLAGSAAQRQGNALGNFASRLITRRFFR